MDSELAEAIQAALKCKRAASLRLVASSCRPATSGNVREGRFCRPRDRRGGHRLDAAGAMFLSDASDDSLSGTERVGPGAVGV